MALSILEFAVYGLIGYSSLLMLIISTIKEVPDTKAGSISRAIYLIPGAICCILLASGESVILASDTTNTIVSLNTTEVWTETISSSITLQNTIWTTVHILFFFVIVFYVFTQLIDLLTKKN